MMDMNKFIKQYRDIGSWLMVKIQSDVCVLSDYVEFVYGIL